MTKIDIFSGFLGAGKTTLIKKMIEEAYPGEKLAVIENEFGEINIDSGFLKDSGIYVSEMSAGCICCSLVGDFSRALKEVHQQHHPDRILIEPSGVGKLSDVIAAVKNTAAEEPELCLNSYVTVADATKVKTYIKNFGEFYNNQIESAGAIILSRTQKLSQEKLEAAVSLLRDKNPDAVILTTPWDQMTGKTILSAVEGASLSGETMKAVRREHGERAGSDQYRRADDVFTSWGEETPRSYSRERIEEILTALDSGEYGNVIRAKGIVPCGSGRWIHFDYVPAERDIRFGPADYTGRLCVIGEGLQEDQLRRLFNL